MIREELGNPDCSMKRQMTIWIVSLSTDSNLDHCIVFSFQREGRGNKFLTFFHAKIYFAQSIKSDAKGYIITVIIYKFFEVLKF